MNENNQKNVCENVCENAQENQPIQQKPDTRHRGWIFTINNPVQTETELFEYLKGLYNVRYFVFAKEKGDKEETIHFQGYIEFSEPKYFSKMKNDFSEPYVKPSAHIQMRKGTKKQARDYAKKVGEYADKKHTQIGEALEYGTLPGESGQRTDLENIVQMINDDIPLNDIKAAYPSQYLMYHKNIEHLYNRHLAEKYKKTRRLDLEVTYLYGAAGAGKTRCILDLHGDDKVYRVTDYSDLPFDNYDGEEVLIFEEYRSQIKIDQMLNYLDIYPLRLRARYNNKVACYQKVYVVSNWKPYEQYKNVQLEHPETWRAFVRRFHKVAEFKNGGLEPASKTAAFLPPVSNEGLGF